MPARTRSSLAVIVGAGLMGRWHARAAVRAGARVAAIVDPDAARASALARGYPACLTAASIDALPRLEGPGLLHVCTPIGAHATTVRQGLTRKWPALVEKPVTEGAAETAALIQAATTEGVWICPVHQFIFQRGMQSILGHLPRLGELVNVRATVYSAGADGQSSEASDRIATEILPHPLSILERLRPGALGGMAWSARRARAGDVSIAGQGHGLSVSIVISMHARPTVNEMVVAGTRATALADLFHGFATWDSGEVSRTSKMRRPFSRASATAAGAGSNLVRRAVSRQSAYPGLWELVAACHASVRSGTPPPITAAETLAVAEARDQICRLVSDA